MPLWHHVDRWPHFQSEGSGRFAGLHVVCPWPGSFSRRRERGRADPKEYNLVTKKIKNSRGVVLATYYQRLCGLTRPQDHQGPTVEDEVEDMVQGMTPEEFAAELAAGLADVGAVRLENGGWDSFASLSCGDLEEEQQDRVVLGVMTGAPGAISAVLPLHNVGYGEQSTGVE